MGKILYKNINLNKITANSKLLCINNDFGYECLEIGKIYNWIIKTDQWYSIDFNGITNIYYKSCFIEIKNSKDFKEELKVAKLLYL